MWQFPLGALLETLQRALRSRAWSSHTWGWRIPIRAALGSKRRQHAIQRSPTGSVEQMRVARRPGRPEHRPPPPRFGRDPGILAPGCAPRGPAPGSGGKPAAKKGRGFSFRELVFGCGSDVDEDMVHLDLSEVRTRAPRGTQGGCEENGCRPICKEAEPFRGRPGGHMSPGGLLRARAWPETRPGGARCRARLRPENGSLAPGGPPTLGARQLSFAADGRTSTKHMRHGTISSRVSLVGDFFAAMSPVMCSRFLLMLAPCDRIPAHGGAPRAPQMPLCVSFVEVKRAHPMGRFRRAIAVEPPFEFRKKEQDGVGLFQRAIYGTRETAPCWEIRDPPPPGRIRVRGRLGRPLHFLPPHAPLPVHGVWGRFHHPRRDASRWFADRLCESVGGEGR